jgi:hypothetical protein
MHLLRVGSMLSDVNWLPQRVEQTFNSQETSANFAPALRLVDNST